MSTDLKSYKFYKILYISEELFNFLGKLLGFK